MSVLLLVDGSSYLYRAFHALPDLRNSAGEPTGAVVGVLNMLRRLESDYKAKGVAYKACVFDAKGKTFRDDWYPEYKSHRPPMPDDLRAQIAPLHEAVVAEGWPLLSIEGVEADDVIGTLTRQALERGWEVVISTGDKDMCQLVNDNIKLEDSFKDKVMDYDAVVEKFGVRPDQIIDYLTLMGDSSDGIKGIPKVGAKTAAKWLQQYGTIGGILENIEQIKGAVGQSLRDHADTIPLNHQLASIICDLPLALDWHDLKLAPANVSELKRLYTELDFRGALQSLEHPNHPDNLTSLAVHTDSEAASTTTAAATPRDWHTILTEDDFQQLLSRLHSAEQFVIDTETTALDWRTAQIVGLSFALQAEQAYYLPLAHDYMGAPEQLNRESVLAQLKPILENPNIGKIGQHLKYDAHVLSNHGIQLQGWAFDTMLASYVINPTATRHNMDDLAKFYLDYQTTSFEDVAGKGVKQLTFNQIELEKAAPYACEDADVTFRLYQLFSEKLKDLPALKSLLLEVEMPTAQILTEMESNGILLDRGFLTELSQRFAEQILGFEKTAHELAGQPFNVASPKQLGEILFDKLGIAGGKKTASGQYATSEAILEKIEHPLAETVLEYRGLSKLKSTYTDALPEQVDRKSGRIHTSFSMALTNTGRLSSTDPNLQNIPIRTAEGREIRKAFIAAPGYRLISADYSQIELRIVAAISGDPNMCEAFKQRKDIHTATAAKVYGVTESEVTKEMRYKAKSVNFGIIYGQGAFGLAENLGVSRKEAQEIINNYKKEFPYIQKYMDDQINFAKENDYVQTLMGRKRWLRDIHSANFTVRGFAERNAINSPIQGTAADMIKKAMVDMNKAFKENNIKSKMILQVHDELVFDVIKDELDKVMKLIIDCMVSALPLPNDVPVEAEVGRGNNWLEAH